MRYAMKMKKDVTRNRRSCRADQILQQNLDGKESYLKCIGTGIRQKLSNLDLSEVLDGKTYEEVYHFLSGRRRFSGGSLSENKKMLSNLSVIYMEENENNNL